MSYQFECFFARSLNSILNEMNGKFLFEDEITLALP